MKRIMGLAIAGVVVMLLVVAGCKTNTTDNTNTGPSATGINFNLTGARALAAGENSAPVDRDT